MSKTLYEGLKRFRQLTDIISYLNIPPNLKKTVGL